MLVKKGVKIVKITVKPYNGNDPLHKPFVMTHHFSDGTTEDFPTDYGMGNVDERFYIYIGHNGKCSGMKADGFEFVFAKRKHPVEIVREDIGKVTW